MRSNSWATPLAIGLVGTVIVGILAREWQPMALGIFIVGVASGLIGVGWRPAASLGIGIALALPVLIAIQFGTTVETFVNTEDAGELAGLLPLVLLIWAAFVGAGLAGFAAATLGRRLLGRASAG
jgi:hypothetical protein